QKGNIKYEDNKLIYESITDADEYIVECGKAVSAIDSAADKVKQSLTILQYDYIEALDCEEYNLAEYIEYHIENYIIRAHSIYDRTLIFINKLLQLGIDNSNIGHALIVSNENVKKFGLDAPLKSLKKEFKAYHHIRNSIIHHDRFKDEEFDIISLYHKSQQLLKASDQDPMLNEDV
ncbi:Cthe_2314 family HEPN domain-containing protein, partial [Vibrio diabolicus]